MNTHRQSPSLNLYEILYSHRKPMMWTFSAIMVLTIAVTFLGKKTYTSEAKLFVRLGRESVTMDPTATAATEQVVMVQESREFEINSVYELFRSRDVLASVVEGVGPQTVLGREPSAEVQTAGLLASFNLFAPYSIDDAAIYHMSKHLKVAPVKKSNIINIAYDANDPELARTVVASLIEQARDAHIRVNRTDGSHDFFLQQSQRLRDRLTALENDLRDKKNASQIASLVDQRGLALRQASDLHTELMAAEAKLGAVTAEVASHQQLLGTIPAKITVGETTNMPHSAVSSMREQLFTAQIREKELLSRCTKDHPQAIAAADQITALQVLLASERVEPQVAQAPNHAHQELNLLALKGTSSAASLKAHAAKVREQLDGVLAELNKYNNSEAELARLEREIEIESDNYKRYNENLEQARIDHELVMNNISNVNVLQPPSASITPSRPRRKLNLAMGLVIAMASSLGVGLMLEHRKSGLFYRLAGGRMDVGMPANQPTSGAPHGTSP